MLTRVKLLRIKRSVQEFDATSLSWHWASPFKLFPELTPQLSKLQRISSPIYINKMHSQVTVLSCQQEVHVIKTLYLICGQTKAQTSLLRRDSGQCFLLCCIVLHCSIIIHHQFLTPKRAFEKGDKEGMQWHCSWLQEQGRSYALLTQLFLNSKGEFRKVWCIMQVLSCLFNHTCHLDRVELQLSEKIGSCQNHLHTYQENWKPRFGHPRACLVIPQTEGFEGELEGIEGKFDIENQIPLNPSNLLVLNESRKRTTWTVLELGFAVVLLNNYVPLIFYFIRLDGITS